MHRPNFLSNKKVACGFCKLEFFGNLNKENLIMCYKCIHDLCVWSDKKRSNFLAKFKEQKDKEKLIKRFINKEVVVGKETSGYSEHCPRIQDNRRVPVSKKQKNWKITGSLIMDLAGAQVHRNRK